MGVFEIGFLFLPVNIILDIYPHQKIDLKLPKLVQIKQ